MLKNCFYLLLFSLFLFSCQNNKKAYLKSLNKDSLPSQFLVIDNTRDTSLQTANGAIIKIAKGSFSKDKVKLQVKEAYSIEQMILAGLTTESNGKPLSSGGMIYINSVEGGVKMNKPISISIPTNFYDNRMQVYKGEEKDGKINWVDPQPLPAQDSLPPYLQQGKILFQQNCASCHGLDKAITGPALMGVRLRGPWKNRENLFAFTRDPAAFMATSRYVLSQKCMYGIMMPAFPAIGDEGLNAIYDYIKNETLKRGITDVPDPISDCLDSCRRYDSLYRLVNHLKDSRQTLINDNGNRISYTRLGVPPSKDNVGRIPKVTPGDDEGNEHKALYYQFDVTSFGWYNIDRLLDYASAEDSKLIMQVDESLTDEFDIFIAVPQYKTFDRGGKLNDGKNYGFLGTNGEIPLPLNTRVIVFAIGEAEGKIVFGYKEFLSQRLNSIQVIPELVTKEEFNSTVKTFSLDKVDVNVADSKNADAIRQADKEIKSNEELLELYRPKKCACNCGEESTDSTSAYLIRIK